MDNSNESKKLRNQTVAIILTICAVSIFFIFLIYSQNIVFGSILGNWEYRYFHSFSNIPIWMPLVLLLLVGAQIFIGHSLIEKHEKAILLGVFITAVVVQILLQSIYQYSMGELISSNASNSFFSVAKSHTAFELLSKYQSLLPTFSAHAATNMPGKILFYQFLLLFTKSPQTMGYLIIVVSTIGGVLLYEICKLLFQNKFVALYSFILYSLIPCKQEFFPILNTVTPVFILLSLYLFLLYLNTKKKVFLVLLGVSIYVLILFEPSPLVTGILFIFFLFYYLIQKQITLKEVGFVIAIPLLSFLATYGLVYLATSFNLWQVFTYMMNDAAKYNIKAKRSYPIWVREDAKEFFFGVGIPVMLIFLYEFFTELTNWDELRRGPSHWCARDVYLLGTALIFVVVLLLGINRGEITRLWIYLAVFFQVPAAIFLGEDAKNKGLFYVVAAILVFQLLITLPRVAFINP